jgi:dethiobiotin synthetase
MTISSKAMPRGVFITGSDTDVGKTWVGCLLIKAMRKMVHRVAAYKPVASGVEMLEDSDPYRLWQASGETGTLDMVCPQVFRAALAPPLAARKENRTVDIDRMRQGFLDWEPHADFVVVEGAGGWLSPLATGFTNADLACELGLPVLVVVSDRVGAINQTLLTLESILHRGLTSAGVALNEGSQATSSDIFEYNAAEIRTLTKRTADVTPPIFRIRVGQMEWDSLDLIGRLLDGLTSSF